MKTVLLLEWDPITPSYQNALQSILGDEPLELITERELGIASAYAPSQTDCLKIKQLTQRRDFDLIIVGNNLGAGLTKVEHIAEKARSKTLVRFNMFARGEREAYEAMGITHFEPRTSDSVLRSMLGAQ